MATSLREPWEMTQAEAWATEPKLASGKHAPNRPGVLWQRQHKDTVERALRNGKPAPAEVLADYPDLAAKYGTNLRERSNT